MAYVYRDFDIYYHEYGHKGNIEISIMNEGILNVFVFGINGGYGHAYIKVNMSNNLDLYDNCKAILDKITDDYKEIVYLGYRDYIDVDDKNIDLSKDYELTNLLIKDAGFPQIVFNKENINYLLSYKLIYDISLEDTWEVIHGEVTDDGIFRYNEYSLLHYEDDYVGYTVSEECSKNK